MKLGELIETNGAIVYLEATARSLGKFIHRWKIGPSARYCPGDYAMAQGPGFENADVKELITVIQRSLNFHDQGRDFWGVDKRMIPQDLLDADVVNWQCWNFRGNTYQLIVTIRENQMSIFSEAQI